MTIGRERLRQILIAEGITFQRTKTWKESPDPLKNEKLARIEWLLEHARDRTFAFDEFGPSPSSVGRIWRAFGLKPWGCQMVCVRGRVHHLIGEQTDDYDENGS